MDITVNPLSGAVQSYKSPAATTAQTQVTPQTVPVPTPVNSDNQQAIQASASATSGGDSDSAYEDTIRKAALSFKDTYAVSDKSFTIFKDASGKYITRYVSLRDGSVTYMPEPTLMKQVMPDNQPVKIALSA